METNFQGITRQEGGGYPPDTMGAVSATHVVQMINGRVRITDRNGTPLPTPYDKTLSQFWQAAGLGNPIDVFDPRIEFDPVAQRWYTVASFNRTSATSSLLFAVSASADPTANWTAFKLDADSDNNQWVDFEDLIILAARYNWNLANIAPPII